MLSQGTTFVKITAVSEQVAAHAMKKNDRGIFSSSMFEKIVLLNKNKIVLQIGAFTEEKGARELKNKVEKLGVNSVFITKVRSARTIYYRVRIGPIKTLKSYERVISKLTSLSLDINLISE
jgi:cell division septation protein DedD